MTRSVIAREVGVAPSTICRWLSATRYPGFEQGVALIELAEHLRDREESR